MTTYIPHVIAQYHMMDGIRDKRVLDTSNDLHRTSQPSHISHRLDTTSTQDNTGTSDWTLQEWQKTHWTPQECQKDRLDTTGMSKGQTRHHRNVKRADWTPQKHQKDTLHTIFTFIKVYSIPDIINLLT